MPVSLVTPGSVRAVLGVSSKELPDTVLGNVIYATQLREDLYDMHLQIVDDFTAAAAATPPTSAQQRFLDLAQTYAAYNVAAQCLVSLPMFAPLTIKDEKAELTRNANSYAKLQDDVGAVLSIIRARLLAAYAAVNPAAPAPAAVERTLAVTTGLAFDPVTGV